MNEEKRAIIDRLDRQIKEGETIENFKTSEAWTIIKRTINGLFESYQSECFEAGQKEDRAIRNYLGRMEAAREILDIFENRFREQMESAIEHKNQQLQEISEQQELDQGVQDHVQSPVYPGESPGLV